MYCFSVCLRTPEDLSLIFVKLFIEQTDAMVQKDFSLQQSFEDIFDLNSEKMLEHLPDLKAIYVCPLYSIK